MWICLVCKFFVLKYYVIIIAIAFRYSTISYVEQTPWLMKATIRDNIIFGEPFRPRRYEKVLLSCCLKQDIDLMPDGDMTEIGTNGLNLSGGQRQRITIARALYSSANVVIMVKSFNFFASMQRRQKKTPLGPLLFEYCYFPLRWLTRRSCRAPDCVTNQTACQGNANDGRKFSLALTII